MNDKILLPKGTILDHYVTKSNMGKGYKWYYLASQKYTNMARGYLHKEQYLTIEDIYLTKYHLAELVERKTRTVITTPGCYEQHEYYFKNTGRSADIYVKNRENNGNPPSITNETLSCVPYLYIGQLHIDPLQKISLHYPAQRATINDEDIDYDDSRSESWMYIQYEIILKNNLVVKI